MPPRPCRARAVVGAAPRPRCAAAGRLTRRHRPGSFLIRVFSTILTSVFLFARLRRDSVLHHVSQLPPTVCLQNDTNILMRRVRAVRCVYTHAHAIGSESHRTRYAREPRESRPPTLATNATARDHTLAQRHTYSTLDAARSAAPVSTVLDQHALCGLVQIT